MNMLRFIEETMNDAGQELLLRFNQPLKISDKPDNSIVTDADLASEKLVLSRIRAKFPDDAIISEESGQVQVKRNPGQYVWIVDPLDGTTNFANGFPFFSISVARGVFTEHGIEVQHGGILDPVRGKSYLAARGGGATCNGDPIQVRGGRDLNRCFLVTGFYYTQGEVLTKEIERFHKVAQTCQSIRRDGSAALDLALVAAGVFDAFWERGLAVWDVAAGSLLVQEAGGYIVNYPKENSASLGDSALPVSYNIEGDGVIAGSKRCARDISKLLS